jgi:hypothetical protein
MRTSTWRSAFVALWLLPACGDSTTGEETAAPTSTNGPATTTGDATTPGTTAAEGSAEGSDGMPTTTAADSTSAAPTTGPEPTSSGGSEGETAGACEPPPPEGNACLECAAASCCTAWAACQADEPCACVVDCHVVNGGSLGNCSNQCNLDTELYQALYFCGQQSCLGTCEWDCC